MDAGLYTLQLADLLVAYVGTSGVKGVKARIYTFLNMNSLSLGEIKATLREYVLQLGDGEEDGPDVRRLKDRISHMISGL
jgi:hypothetical protein